jgi:hypothetical protein
MTAMLRSAFGTGLGFLSSMLFELKNSGVKKSSEGDDNSDGLSGDANGEKKNAGPGALFFAMKQPNPRHRFWTWGLRLEQFRFTC